MPKLSKRLIDVTRTQVFETRTVLWDTDVKGFGFLCLPSGAASYIFDYRNANGQKRRATIGKLGALTPDQARAIAEGWSALVRAGGDPLAVKQGAREAFTLNDLFDRYLASARFAAKADSARPLDIGRIDHHLRPLVGSVFAEALTLEQIRKAFAAIRDGQSQKHQKSDKPRGFIRARGGATAARDCIIVLRTCLNWAVSEGLLKEHPANGFKLPPQAHREAFLDDPAHYVRLFAALAQLEEERRIRPAVADAFRMMALTGARPAEITRCQWKHIDLRASAIVLPPDKHKAGKATGRNRIIPLTEDGLAIVTRQPPGTPDDYVFRPSKGDGPLSYATIWREKVRPAADFPEGIVPYSLRHSVASWMALDGAQAAQLMAALGHSQMSTTQKYIHFAGAARAELAERAAAPAAAGLRAVGKGREPSSGS